MNSVSSFSSTASSSGLYSSVPGRLLIHGLMKQTLDSTIYHYFNQFGEVLGAMMDKDRATGLGWGFGFVQFLHPTDADKALAEAGNHTIDGKKIGVIKAPVKTINYQPNNKDGRPKKIFVGGLPLSITQSQFQAYFEGFGAVENAHIMHDTNTNKPRGFGFVTFISIEAYYDVLKNPYHTLLGKQVEVKSAVGKITLSLETQRNLTRDNSSIRTCDSQGRGGYYMPSNPHNSGHSYLQPGHYMPRNLYSSGYNNMQADHYMHSNLYSSNYDYLQAANCMSSNLSSPSYNNLQTCQGPSSNPYAIAENGQSSSLNYNHVSLEPQYHQIGRSASESMKTNMDGSTSAGEAHPSANPAKESPSVNPASVA